MACQITIQGSDGENFKVPLGPARRSVYMRKMLKYDVGVKQHIVEDIPEVHELPFSTKVLKKVFSWCKQHEKDSKPVNENDAKRKSLGVAL